MKNRYRDVRLNVDCGMLMVVNVTAAMFRDMIACNPTNINSSSEGYNILGWKLELNL